VTPRVLAGMEFRPAISSDLKVMEGGVFEPRRLGLRERWDARAAAAGPGPR
jgi:acyl CoA:acetate/3-ketoacid CoA transferase